MKSPRFLRLVLALGLALMVRLAPARGQAPTSLPKDDGTGEKSSSLERFKELTEPEKMLEKRKKALEKVKPAFEFFRSQVLPFDVLPYVKAGHWNTMTLEMRANLEDYNGILQSAPVALLDMPHEMVFRRDARLVKEQQQKVALQVMLPHVAKELTLELTRPDAIRGEGQWPATLMRMEPHQMLVPILSAEPSAYSSWSRLMALVPASGDRDPGSLDKQRYYRLVTSQNPEKPPPLSTHPLTWTTTSHIIWDGLLPEALNVGQQQALLDWLHWGGQLIIVGGAGPSLTTLKDSFLGEYLPATVSAKNVTLGKEDLDPLSEAYPQPVQPGMWTDVVEGRADVRMMTPPKYFETKDTHIRPGPKKSIYLSGLTPLAGATPLPLGDPGGHLLGVEARVGRGRILMLAVKPTDPALVAWPGLDSLVRRLILRRPEETWAAGRQVYGMLSGRDLTWLRYVGRDLGAFTAPDPSAQQPGTPTTGEALPSGDPVAAWLDSSTLPVKSRMALQKASGLTIPGRDFVLKVILAYGLALVPLNWLICRYVLRRRELAWVVVPILAFSFAIVVERAAAYDMGFDSACDEVDLLEIQGDYPRGHLSRFGAVYSTGRVRYSIAYPSDPTALALPMSMENQLRGEETLQSVWQSSPEPALMGFPVQPRSLAMFRAEQMINLPGGVAWVQKGGSRQVVNATGLTLREAVLVETGTKRRYPLGTIAAGATVPVGAASEPAKPTAPRKRDEPEPEVAWLATDRAKMSPREPFLEVLRSYDWGRPEDRGEWRLVAWAEAPHPGQKIEPAVDRHRGFRLVVAHVAYGPPPDSAARPYFTADAPRMAVDTTKTPATDPNRGQFP